MDRFLVEWPSIRGLGYEGWASLSDGEWRGWEVEFLRVAVGVMHAYERDQQVLDQARLWGTLLTGGARRV